MLYQSPIIALKKMRSTDAKALYDFVHKEHESPTHFVKDKTGKDRREDHNAEYQLLLRLFEKGKPFSHKMWNRLEDTFGIKKEDLSTNSKTNTIIGDGNIQDSSGSSIGGDNKALKEEIENLQKRVLELENIISDKDYIIQLLQKRA